MKEIIKDRRVKYTISALKNALVELLQKEHISKISVKSLCELADINRSTFYSHFEDQYDLLHYIQDDIMDKIKLHLEAQPFENGRPVNVQVLCRILEYVRENADLFKALLSDNCEPEMQRKLMDFTQLVSFRLNKKYDKRVREYFNIYATTGCISVLQKWLKDGMIESDLQISEYIMQMLCSGMASFE